MQSRYLSSLLLAAALLSPLVGVGCGDHHYYRAYDEQHHDYHRFNHHEDVYYQQWTAENHHDRVEFKSLSPDDQRRYWAWRHDHH